MSLSADEQALVSRSVARACSRQRYADLDPGASCAAAPYIDRCDPSEPYACYRATNMSAQPYGAFLAVNSPRHCSHDEATAASRWTRCCNECVNRVCQVDPTCCGDPRRHLLSRAAWSGTSVASRIRQQVVQEHARSRRRSGRWARRRRRPGSHADRVPARRDRLVRGDRHRRRAATLRRRLGLRSRTSRGRRSRCRSPSAGTRGDGRDAVTLSTYRRSAAGDRLARGGRGGVRRGGAARLPLRVAHGLGGQRRLRLRDRF